MNKSELIDAIAQDTGFTKADAGRALDSFMNNVVKELARGGKVELTGFGSFSISHRAERQGRNPQTGATITIKAAKLPKFKAGKALKDAVAEAA